MKKGFLIVLSCVMFTLIHSQNIVKAHYTVSGGLLGAANFSKFKITDNNTANVEYDTKPGWSVGAWVNFPVGKSFSIEPQVMRSSYRYVTPNNASDVLIKDGKIRYYSVPLLLKFHTGDHIAIIVGPQLDFTSSVENNSGTGSIAQESDFKQTSFSAFGGLELFPHGRITLFSRYIFGLTNMNNTGSESTVPNYKNRNLQAGLKIRLFGSKVEADSDGDGVIDKNDKCPSTFGYARYDGCPIPDTDGDGINDEEDKCPNQAGTLKYQGCPIPDRDKDGINDEEDKCPDVAGLAKYQGCPIPDTDKDGINDEEDKCPDVAGIAKYQGCPIPDTDKDGINDEEDKCPDVPGVAANQGCPAVAEVSPEVNKALGGTGQSVLFTSNSGKLATTSNASLNKIATILKNNPDVKIKIEGHADNKEKNADDLAMQRANAVKNYFVSKGISADRIKVDTEGSSMPIGDNNTVAGRTKNRRVEIKLDM